jgi:DNA-binding response OmpR family regulator
MAEESARILLVDDEQAVQTLLTYPLRRDGYEVIAAGDGHEALRRFAEQRFDLVVLDLMLPKLDGIEVCRRMRSRSQVPIIMLTAKGDEIDKVVGLEMGADDYITKPFSVRELLARVRAVMRRLDETSGKTYEDDHLLIDFDDIRVVCHGQKVKLTNKEFSLLSVLAKSTDRVITRQQLLDNVWGYSYYGDARTLDVHIRRLRQKLGECGDCIETVVGVGYRFVGCPTV